MACAADHRDARPDDTDGDSLFRFIDTEGIRCMNESEAGSARRCIKPYASKRCMQALLNRCRHALLRVLLHGRRRVKLDIDEFIELIEPSAFLLALQRPTQAAAVLHARSAVNR